MLLTDNARVAIHCWKKKQIVVIAVKRINLKTTRTETNEFRYIQKKYFLFIIYYFTHTANFMSQYEIGIVILFIHLRVSYIQIFTLILFLKKDFRDIIKNI